MSASDAAAGDVAAGDAAAGDAAAGDAVAGDAVAGDAVAAAGHDRSPTRHSGAAPVQNVGHARPLRGMIIVAKGET
jgi:hypothetical protein